MKLKYEVAFDGKFGRDFVDARGKKDAFNKAEKMKANGIKGIIVDEFEVYEDGTQDTRNYWSIS